MTLSKPINVAIIMDGNGRWAQAQNKPRIFGHKCGLDALKKLVNDIVDTKMKVKWLSLFAFSVENWNRPKKEVKFLMSLLNNSLNDNLVTTLNKKNIKFVWTGFENKLSSTLIKKIRNVELKTKNNKGLILNIVFNYSGTKDIEYATKHKCLVSKNVPPIDLLIRTSDEKRISNFLLYQLAYSEIVFEKTLWPDYTIDQFKNNIIEYKKRERRFGKIYEQ